MLVFSASLRNGVIVGQNGSSCHRSQQSIISTDVFNSVFAKFALVVSFPAVKSQHVFTADTGFVITGSCRCD